MTLESLTCSTQRKRERGVHLDIMAKLALESDRTSTTSTKLHHTKHHPRSTTTMYSPKVSFYLLATCATLFILFHIQSLQLQAFPEPPSSPLQSWSFTHQWQKFILNTSPTLNNCTQDLNSMAGKLRDAVTFLPLKDLRYSTTAQQGHTWFMSSMYDTQEEGEVQFQHFPSKESKGRILCFKGKDKHDGAWNSYALAWPEALPYNSTLLKGLTFVSNNHYNYDNIWHGLSAVFPFVAWHLKKGCAATPNRWVLYHWGELRTRMGPWLRSLMEATFGGPLNIEVFEGFGVDENGIACFEEAVVMRHNEGGMSRARRIEAYDFIRCKAREFCNVSLERMVAEGGGRPGIPEIGMTMFMRTGPRSFRNESAVIGIFERECRKVEGCRLMVAHSNNLTICEQVKLMSLTDVLVSPHGAQLTNMFLMDKNSSVMEFFPRGWLKLAGVGQYVYHWIASWSSMNHRGAWRDPNGEKCPYPEDDRRCMSIYKSGKIGYNETDFADWARSVIQEVKIRKTEEAAASMKNPAASSSGCACNYANVA